MLISRQAGHHSVLPRSTRTCWLASFQDRRLGKDSWNRSLSHTVDEDRLPHLPARGAALHTLASHLKIAGWSPSC
jgi:hypothetical protein